MFRPCQVQRLRRRGVILLIVLSLLTLMAIVGLAFVLYAEAAANAARLYREAASPSQPDLNPELALALFLGQLLYDVPDDVSGVYSALRGHSLARSMYGWNTAWNPTTGIWTPIGNATPYNGTGRLHAPSFFANPPATPPAPKDDDYNLINYTYFPGDGFLRDPERLGWRTSLDPRDRGPDTGGFNAPYTYPDLNSLFLAAVRADGTVLIPSFHRPWLFGPLDSSNPNWTNPHGKYLILRPRPADHLGFPPPEDATGDVKNLIGGPGGNDSLWIDIGAPVMVAKDGRKYKMLVAPLIVDLDGRVNVNVHGNMRGANASHVSNQSWGPWEVNLGRVLTQGNEWANLFVGSSRPAQEGRYGADQKPSRAGSMAPFGKLPPFYSRVDFDGCNEGAGGVPTAPVAFPGFGASAFSCFPSYPAGYGNASVPERTDHPSLYNVFQPSQDDRSFALSNLEALLRYGDKGSPALSSELFRLCPQNFSDPRLRRLVTTHSFDVDKPGVLP